MRSTSVLNCTLTKNINHTEFRSCFVHLFTEIFTHQNMYIWGVQQSTCQYASIHSGEDEYETYFYDWQCTLGYIFSSYFSSSRFIPYSLSLLLWSSSFTSSFFPSLFPFVPPSLSSSDQSISVILLHCVVHSKALHQTNEL